MIKIIDNFFSTQLFEKIKNHITTKLHYTPKYFDGTNEKNNLNYYGSRFSLSEDKELLKVFITQAEKKFQIKIKKTHGDSGIDIRNLDHFAPHTDFSLGAKINVLVMLSGPTAVTNGTVFYYTDKDNKKELDIHVGFRENRAILFPSNWWHSAHASNVPNLKRYTATLFIEDYEE
jgi:hypothetical protein